jgi:hypothetical protein
MTGSSPSPAEVAAPPPGRWALLARFGAHLDRQGPAMQSALLRIALVALLWDRWASDFLLYKAKSPLQWAVFVSFMLATPLLLVGLCTRFAAWWTAATMLGVFYGLGVMEGADSYTHHHTFLLTMYAVIMPLLPCGRALSIDRWIAIRRAEARGEPIPAATGPTWAVPLLGIQLSAMYFWAAFDKCSWAFASGSRLHHIFQWFYGSADPIEIPGFATLMMAGGIGTIVGEFALAVFPWVRRLRGPTLLIGVIFHGVLFALLPVGPFSATVWAMYLAYYSAEEVDEFVRRLVRTA